MEEFPNIKHMLKVTFNVEDGLSEDVAIRLYQRAAKSSANFEALKQELQMAFSRTDVSWKEILLNTEYEVFDAENEDEAREYALKILWKPIFEG
jgi:hypothetical protein